MKVSELKEYVRGTSPEVKKGVVTLLFKEGGLDTRITKPLPPNCVAYVEPHPLGEARRGLVPYIEDEESGEFIFFASNSWC
jgi:hypothetical protein